MDEMDLVGKLKEAPPLRPEAYERARATLKTAMAESVHVPAPVRKFSWARNFRFGIAGKVGIGVVGAAAVAVTVLSVDSPDAGTPDAPAAQATVVASRLMLLGNEVNANSGAVPGDASLVVRNRTAPDSKPYLTYHLYTDAGDVYVTDTQDALPGAIARGDTLAEPTDARVMAAARAAATGDVNKARDAMVNAIPNPLGLGLSPEEAQKVWDKAQVEVVEIKRAKGVKDPRPEPRPTGKALQGMIDNRVWTNSIDALSQGAANPEIRAGVLRLISTIADVAVVDTKTDGQPTLTITTGWAVFGGEGEQVLTIDAKTGLPVSSVWKQKTGPSSTTTYKSTRVTLADIKAGRF